MALTTSQNQSHRGSVVPIPKGMANLNSDSLALCHQVFVIDKSKLTQVIGDLPVVCVKDVDRALKVALYLP